MGGAFPLDTARPSSSRPGLPPQYPLSPVQDCCRQGPYRVKVSQVGMSLNLRPYIDHGSVFLHTVCITQALTSHLHGAVSYNKTQKREGRRLDTGGAMQKEGLGPQAEV